MHEGEGEKYVLRFNTSHLDDHQSSSQDKSIIIPKREVALQKHPYRVGLALESTSDLFVGTLRTTNLHVALKRPQILRPGRAGKPLIEVCAKGLTN